MELNDRTVLQHHVVGEVVERVVDRYVVGDIGEDDENIDIAGEATGLVSGGRTEDVETGDNVTRLLTGAFGEGLGYRRVGIRREIRRPLLAAHATAYSRLTYRSVLADARLLDRQPDCGLLRVLYWLPDT